MKKIQQYFPELTDKQLGLFAAFMPLFTEWNEQINMVSRKDINNLEVRHVLHSLAIAKFMPFNQGATIMDLGTGGGFPGIPLAIFFPETEFILIDSRGKKIMVVKEIVKALGLTNVKAIHGRAEETKVKCDFVVTRAVAKMDKLFNWTRRHLKNKHTHIYPNGIIALKGGDIKAEMKLVAGKPYWEMVEIRDYFDESEFEDKKVVYLQM
ncbi:MAG TPA: 16S rRNA (guanine(527)-N(7))-methyltransferase RsmG [Saprospiraceae bacterium]|nr:16S rRNA (guanine(527)-N(7))-methyltransferase RsmG [Saprospiraceae bacterium]